MRDQRHTCRDKSFHLLFLTLAVTGTLCALAASAYTQTEQVIYSFSPHAGAFPTAGLAFDSSGNLFGTAESGDARHGRGGVFELIPAVGGIWTESELENFPLFADGTNPAAGLTLDASGNLYGTTLGGGDVDLCGYTLGCGLVFEMSQESAGVWKETVLYPFKAGAGGGGPVGGLIFDAAGNIYGTTYSYGNLAGCGGSGCGIVFELSPSAHGWIETILHTFTGGVDGAQPAASLVFDGSGNLYGTTYSGGNLTACPATSGCGVVFELSPSGRNQWKETVLHTFTDGVDGSNPVSNLVFDANGRLYGTTSAGGSANCYKGCGAVFELSQNAQGWKATVIRSFGGGPDGANPAAGLISDSAGNLYGTTEHGGYSNNPCGYANAGCGTVFKLSPTSGVWNLTVLHAFTNDGDGAFPRAGLIFDGAGNLYGTTTNGGVNGDGAVFEVTP
jgi:uncharacterized repeat protein (TIGR03803 family)